MISLGISHGPGPLALCQPIISDKLRRDRIRQACLSPRRERFRLSRCCYCGRRWYVNQFHREPVFSCGDQVRRGDYEF